MYNPAREELPSYQAPDSSNHTWPNNTITETNPCTTSSSSSSSSSSTFFTIGTEANVCTSSAAIQHDQQGDEARELGRFFIQSVEYARGHFFVTAKPEEISHPDPPSIKRPTYPEMRQHSLRHFSPCIFFVQYPCRSKCRSLGICVHYQFVIPCGKCPDGLICSECIQSTSPQEAIMATRKCPLHQDPNQPNPISSRMEDFLATEAQKAACDEILLRSRNRQWEDTTDIPVPPVHSDFVPDRDRYSRERTPRNLDDVKMLDGSFGGTEAGEAGVGTNSGLGPLDQTQPFQPDPCGTNTFDESFSLDLFGGPLGMQSWP
ncbi:hypothetical protein PV08_00760 [Exophiala spinifera]|uniref:Uncharacterized protein n=1 Tax=Exophiala spinifera TaxID=91928 RepID=A0A0D2BNS8_9EURO|nr:uncharacterized protein PV08_00760 [Exophiala spinifera]KIW20185.1 hypothetical protein PV08_00760 [Exophiala spinifera]